MTVIRESSIKWNGLSTDTKPTPVTTPSYFNEYNTGLQWLWDGTEWILPQNIVAAGMKKFGELDLRGSTVTTGSGIFNPGAYFGTNTASVGAALGTLDIMDTSASINTCSGYRFLAFTSRLLNPVLKVMFRLNHITKTRLFIGFHNQVGANPTTNADPFNAGSGKGIGLWLDTDVSGDFKIASNNGSDASSSIIALATPIAADTSTTRILEIRAIEASTKFQLRLGSAAQTDITSDIPAQTDALGFMMWIENTEALSKTCSVPIIKCRMDQP